MDEGEVARDARAVATHLHARGARRGDVVLTLLGNRPEWVLTMIACFRQGFVALPCTEQLRAKGLRLRLDVAQPRIVVADERNADALCAAGWDGPTVRAPRSDLPEQDAPPPPELAPEDPCLITFTSRTAGDVIISAGYRIAPFEVESALTGHARELRDHVKAETAPYKYPRIVDFATELPRTPSGKVGRAALR
jgi:acyl-coenzyme A synthetase/AMP-(fatty) acid ligase